MISFSPIADITNFFNELFKSKVTVPEDDIMFSFWQEKQLDEDINRFVAYIWPKLNPSNRLKFQNKEENLAHYLRTGELIQEIKEVISEAA